MIEPLILLAFGVAFMIAPGFWAGRSEANRLVRLREIEEGASEAYFEERRDLLEYKPSQRFLVLWRVIGAAMAIAAVGVLLVRSGPTG